jgi:hypothetical protein
MSQRTESSKWIIHRLSLWHYRLEPSFDDLGVSDQDIELPCSPLLLDPGIVQTKPTVPTLVQDGVPQL